MSQYRVPMEQRPLNSKKCFAKIYSVPEKDLAASEREGRPVFCEETVIEIHPPGGKGTVIKKLKFLTAEQREIYADDIERFEKAQGAKQTGMPLAEWPGVTRSQVEEFKFYNIHTVNDLAETPDFALERIGMGARVLRDKAAAFLGNFKDTSSQDKLARENDALKARLDNMEKKMAEILGDKQPKKKGPKPKAKIQDEATNDNGVVGDPT